MKMMKKIINSVCTLAMFLGCGMAVQAEQASYDLSVQWDDADDKFGFRPDSLGFKFIEKESGAKVTEGKVLSTEDWKKTVTFDQEAGKTYTLDMDGATAYSTKTSVDGSKITKTYTSIYKDAKDGVVVTVVWDDNDNAGNTRPDTFDVKITDDFGNEGNYSIEKDKAQFTDDQFPFAVDGTLNSVDITTPGISGYTSEIAIANTNRGMTAKITHKLNAEPAPDPEPDPEPQEDKRNITVNFEDAGDPKQDLSDYTINTEVEKTVEELDVKETCDILTGLGFELGDFEGIIVLEDGKDEYTVEVGHKIDVTKTTEKVNVQRVIHFEGITRADAQQNTEVEKTTYNGHDEVTGKDLEPYVRYTGNIPAYNVQPETGYISDKTVIDAIDFSKVEEKDFKTKYEETVKFTNNYHTVKVTYTDINSKPQDVSEKNKSLNIEMGKTVKLDLSADLAYYEAKGFKVIDKDKIPTTLGDNSADVVVKLDHDTETKKAENTVTLQRTITYTGIKRDPDSQKTNVKINTTIVEDKVTKQVISETETIYGKFDEFKVPSITGYKPDKTSIPLVEIKTREDLRKIYNAVVNYTPDTISIEYLDVNKTDKVDLSKYDTTVAFTETFDIKTYQKDHASTFTNRGFVLNSIKAYGATRYVIEYTHDTKKDTSSKEIVYTRTIINRYENGQVISSGTQNAYASKVTTEEKDLVTGKVLSSKTTREQSGSKNYKLPEYKANSLNGYVPDVSVIKEVNVLTENIDENTTVYITYRGNGMPTPTPTPKPNPTPNTADGNTVMTYGAILGASVLVVIGAAYVLFENKRRNQGNN